jgi:hypothetical protein
MIEPVFFVGDEYAFSVQSPRPNTPFSLCKIAPNTTTPSCVPFGTTDSYGDWNIVNQGPTGTFTTNDVGTWIWSAQFADGTQAETVFAVLVPLGDTAGNPPPAPPAQILVAADGFPSSTLATLSSWMNWLNQAYVQANVSYPVILSRGVKVSPSPSAYYYTYMPDQILFQTTITANGNTSEGGDYWALCREIAHTRNYPFIFGSYFEESWATAECREVYRAIDQYFPQAWSTKPSQSYGTDGKLLDAHGDCKAVVYGPGWRLINPQNDTGSALLDILSERLTSLGRMQRAVNLGEFATQGEQAGNFDGLARSLGVTNVEGVRPSVLFRRNAVNLTTAPDGIYLGIWGSGRPDDVGATAWFGYSIDLLTFTNGNPARTAGTIQWKIANDTGKIVASGTSTTTAASSAFVALAQQPALYSNGKFLLPEGAYHFTAVAEDASGHPSTDPNFFSEDVFVVVDPSRVLNPGDLIVTANGLNGKFGNLGSCNDLTLVAPQGASISGSGSLCFVQNVPKRTTGGYEDVTLSGYGFIRTAVPSRTSPRVIHLKNLDQPAYLQKVLHVDGSAATSIVSGEMLMLTGIDFTANDPSSARSAHLVPVVRRAPMALASMTAMATQTAVTPLPPRHGGPVFPTEGCTGTNLNDQGRSEVWFSENGTVAKATISYCSDNQMEITVPAGLTPGGNVAISVVVNGTLGLNTLSLPVTAK